MKEEKLFVFGKKQRKVDKQKERVYKGVFQISSDALVRDIGVSFENNLLKITLPEKRIAKQLEKSAIE